MFPGERKKRGGPVMRLSSPLVWVSLLIAAAVAALSGCVGTMPEEEGQTLMTIRARGRQHRRWC